MGPQKSQTSRSGMASKSMRSGGPKDEMQAKFMNQFEQ